MSQIIRLPNGEAVEARSIIAVRIGEPSISNQGTSYEFHHKDRVIIDYGLKERGKFQMLDTALTTIVNFDTPEEARTEAARIINEWEEALKP